MSNLYYRRKPIKGFPFYEIDTEGNIFSKYKIGGLKGELQEEWRKLKYKRENNKSKYIETRLKKNGKSVLVHIHRLLAENFIRKRKGKTLVCHKNGNSQDNRIENLYWGDHKDNILDSVKHGTSKLHGEHFHSSKLKESDVLKIKNLIIDGYTHKQIASKFSVSVALISLIRNNKRWGYMSNIKSNYNEAYKKYMAS